MLKEYLEKNKMSVYSLSKGSGIPYTTVNELVNRKKDINECSLKTVSKIAAYLGLTVEELCIIMGSLTQRSNSISSSWNDARNKTFTFPVVVASDDYDASRIYPLKQRIVYEVLAEIKHDDRIEEVYLFGSSTTIRCNRKSDLDFAIKLRGDYTNNSAKDEISEKIQKICNWNADIIWIDRINKNSKIYKNITNGVRLI